LGSIGSDYVQGVRKGELMMRDSGKDGGKKSSNMICLVLDGCEGLYFLLCSCCIILYV
jgi:hypothetical protein